MRTLIILLVLAVLCSVFVGACKGAMWLNNDESGIWLALHSEEPQAVYVVGWTLISSRLTLYENQQNYSLTIAILTANYRLDSYGYRVPIGYQDSNLETYLAINSQVPEKLVRNKVSQDFDYYIHEYTKNLSELNDGSYTLNLRVTGNTPYYLTFECSGNATLIVDNNPPEISDISIKNATYTENNLELNFTISESFSWIAYSLDGQQKVTIKTAQNGSMINPPTVKTYLTNLTQGTHTLTLYGDDAAGNRVTSETITFTVDQTGPFPVVIATAALAGVAIVGVALLLFRRRLRS
ncbi:MAG TPA: hypothetical protein VLH35_01905 [Candidatus Acidoferrales bacterium]|nr:hypothetical protein [Candidatus Acidoferrales bacterium]